MDTSDREVGPGGTIVLPRDVSEDATENGWQVRAYADAGQLWDDLKEAGDGAEFKALFCRQALIIGQLERIAAWQEKTEALVREFKTFAESHPMFAMLKSQAGK